MLLLKNSSFVRKALLWSSFTLLAINILNFDYIIYHYAKSTTHEGIDHFYLSRLSTDARSYREHIQLLISEIKGNDEVDFRKVQAAWTLLNKNEIFTRGSLDNDSFNHTLGPGRFSIILYDYITEGDITKEIAAKELFYEIMNRDF